MDGRDGDRRPDERAPAGHRPRGACTVGHLRTVLLHANIAASQALSMCAHSKCAERNEGVGRGAPPLPPHAPSSCLQEDGEGQHRESAQQRTVLFSLEGWAAGAMRWLNGESSAAPAKLSKLDADESQKAEGGSDDGDGGGGGDSSVPNSGGDSDGGGGDSSGDDAGDDNIPCEADCGDEEGGGSPSRFSNRGDGDSSSFDLANEDWTQSPNPRPDQLPQGASRNTWPNIVNNKKNVSPLLRHSRFLEFSGMALLISDFTTS